MKYRYAMLCSVLLVGVMMAAPAFSQSQAPAETNEDPDWEMPRLANGHPDLQGYWTTQTFTPMERPDYLGDQAFYTEEEWAELQAQLTVDGADPLARHVIGIADADERDRVLNQTHRDETYVHYDNAIWLATRVPKGLSTRRTSLVTDPPNGKIPPRNAQAQARADARRAARGERGVFDGHELRPLSERCIYYGYNGPPLQNPSYNDISSSKWLGADTDPDSDNSMAGLMFGQGQLTLCDGSARQSNNADLINRDIVVAIIAFTFL